MNDVYDDMVGAANCAAMFKSLGGECNDFVRFLQLEWESYAPDYTGEQKELFYGYLKSYSAFDPVELNLDWKDSYSGRDFGKLVV